MQELGTIGQALYMRLFFHFANLYDGRHQKRLGFSKRYDDVCVEWLGGLSQRFRRGDNRNIAKNDAFILIDRAPISEAIRAPPAAFRLPAAPPGRDLHHRRRGGR